MDDGGFYTEVWFLFAKVQWVFSLRLRFWTWLCRSQLSWHICLVFFPEAVKRKKSSNSYLGQVYLCTTWLSLNNLEDASHTSSWHLETLCYPPPALWGSTIVYLRSRLISLPFFGVLLFTSDSSDHYWGFYAASWLRRVYENTSVLVFSLRSLKMAIFKDCKVKRMSLQDSVFLNMTGVFRKQSMEN